MDYNIEISLEDNEKISTLNIIVSDDHENWVGGISADVYWDWMEINDFWFLDEYRGKGLGGKFLIGPKRSSKRQVQRKYF